MATSQQRLAVAICDFLNKSLTNGSLAPEEADNVEVAVNCIAESFQIDPKDTAAVSTALGAHPSLFALFESAAAAQTTTPSTSASSPETSAPTPNTTATPAAASPSSLSDEDKKKAEQLKSRGNASMASKDYASAIDFYTQALAIHPGNAVFLSNRAAAHSAAKDHEKARIDAEAAVAIDPTYTKAWSRLGLAKFALGDAKGSVEAYQRGIDYEGNGGSDAMRKGLETAKRRAEELESSSSPAAATRGSGAGVGAGAGAGAGGLPDLGSLASLLGGGAGGAGAGAGAGAGGMPDFSNIMNNPMFQNMAQNLMGNPDMMSSIMNNPRLRQMADQFGSGGGMPDLSSMMSDPAIADLARNVMGRGNNNNNDNSNSNSNAGDTNNN